jgi:hypothetical protein
MARRGRPTTGRDPVVAFRLPHEAIADVDRLARTGFRGEERVGLEEAWRF